MPGIVTRLLVRPGDLVVSGQPILILEAMKMENEVRAELGGSIQTVHVTEGESVDGGAPLVSIDPQSSL